MVAELESAGTAVKSEVVDPVVAVIVLKLVKEESAAISEREVVTEADWLVGDAVGAKISFPPAEYSGGPGMM